MKKLLFLSLITASINSAEFDWKNSEISFEDLSQPIKTNSLINLSARAVVNSFSLEEALEKMPADDLKHVIANYWYHKNKCLIHNQVNVINPSNLETITITKNPDLVSVHKDNMVIVSNTEINKQTIKILDLNSNQIIQEIKTAHEDEILATEISENYVITISGSQVNIWNIKTGELESNFKPEKNSDQSLCYKKIEDNNLILCYKSNSYNINIFDLTLHSNSVIKTKDFIYVTVFNNILILVQNYGFETWNLSEKSRINQFAYELKGFMYATRCDNRLILTLVKGATSINLNDIAFVSEYKSSIDLDSNFIPVKEYFALDKQLGNDDDDDVDDVDKTEVSKDHIAILNDDGSIDIFYNDSTEFLHRITKVDKVKPKLKIYKNWLIVAYANCFYIWDIQNKSNLTKIEIDINDIKVAKNHLIIENNNGITVFNLDQPIADFLLKPFSFSEDSSITFGKLIEVDNMINSLNRSSKKHSREEEITPYRNLRPKLDNFEMPDIEISPEDMEQYLQEQQMLIDNLDQQALKDFIDEATAGPATN